MNDALQNKRLYKFYSYNERNLEAISTPYLWFSRLNDFNDPFEGKIRVETKIPSVSDGIKHLKKLFAHKGLPPLQIEQMLQANFIGMNDRDILRTIADSFDDSYQKHKSILIEENGFCSLIASEQEIDANLSIEQDILMWSHYANGLRGFRVEFHPDILLETLQEEPDVTPIIYSSTPPILDLYEFGKAQLHDMSLAATMFFNCLFYKHIAWKYESEIRLGNSRPGRFTYDSRAIKEIVIGEKIGTDQKRVLDRIISSHTHDIPVRKAWISRESYEVVIR